jgi:hypothetical protein
MKFDRKLLLIAPSFVLVCVVAGIILAAIQLRVLVDVGDTWKERSDFISAVERGEKKLDQRQATGLLQYALEVENRRTAAIRANYDLLLALAVMGGVSCVVLLVGIRGVPRQHWPRMSFRRPEPDA